MARHKQCSFLVLAFALQFARGHVTYLGAPNHLHPVHSLYVKPSSDGTTGDLYVAASEDNAGVKTQWFTDQPVNFLPQHLPAAYSSSLTTTNLPGETVVTNQKRAIVSSPPIKYAYALPVSADGNAATATATAAAYPYTIPSAPAPSTEGSKCSDVSASSAQQFYPYPLHLYYSQMMSSFANALNNLKDNSEEGATATVAPQAAAWPSYYPWQYVMVDPSAWTNAQAATTTPAQTSTPATNTSAGSSSEESA